MAAAKARAPKEVLPTVAINTAIQSKIQTGRQEANQFLIERYDELTLAFIALISGKHLMLVGPPGTAKSRLARIICMLIGGRIFDLQFNKFTMPEEVFGPLDIPSLKGDHGGKSKFVRVTTAMLPEADIAHLDELGKASTAIRNTLLKILNEGEFINDGVVHKAPLQCAIASSNEWIGEADDAKEMAALFDRFTLRKEIREISTPAGRERLLFDSTLDDIKFSVSLTPAEILQARADAMQLPFTANAKDVLKNILVRLQGEGIKVGDRRMRWSVSVAKANAYLQGAQAVEPEHLEALAHVLWSEPVEQPAKAAALILKLANPAAAQITKYLGEAQDIVGSIAKDADTGTIVAQAKKLNEIKSKLEGLKDSDRKTVALEFINEHAKELQRQVLGGLTTF